jgi:hypothetical protein
MYYFWSSAPIYTRYNLLMWIEQEVIQIPVTSEVRLAVLFNKQYGSNVILHLRL